MLFWFFTASYAIIFNFNLFLDITKGSKKYRIIFILQIKNISFLSQASDLQCIALWLSDFPSNSLFCNEISALKKFWPA